MLLTMKYVIVFILVVLIVRIDFLLLQVDKLAAKFGGPKTSTDEVKPGEAVIPFSKDLSVKQNPKTIFLSLINNFRSNPIKEVKDLTLSQLQKNRTMFGPKLDPELETEIFRLRDLLHDSNPEAGSLLLELSHVLEGENLEMLKRFLSLWMDIKMEDFLKTYSKTKDTNCLIATTFGDSVVAEEKNNVLFDRERALADIISKDKTDPVVKVFATRCQLVLNLHLSKVVPKTDFNQDAIPQPVQ